MKQRRAIKDRPHKALRSRPRPRIRDKPRAILLSHFLAIAVSPVRPFALSQLGRCRCGLFARELRQEFFVIQRMREHRKVVFYRVLVRFFANGGCAIF
jgi:hypothetical protein